MRRQQPPESQLDLKEKWQDLNQRENQTPEAYAIELETLIDQMDPNIRPTQYERTLNFRQGLKPHIKIQMRARSPSFGKDVGDMDAAIREATEIDSDLGKKEKRPRRQLRTSLTTEDRDLEQSSAEYKGEYRASLIQQGQGEEKVSAISSDHRRKQEDDKKSSYYPCKNGPLCKWKEKGLCKFDHSKILTCRYGKNCKRWEEGSCVFSHPPQQQVFGKRKRADNQDTADDSQK